MQSFASQLSLNDLGSLDDLAGNYEYSDVETDEETDMQLKRCNDAEREGSGSALVTANGFDYKDLGGERTYGVQLVLVYYAGYKTFCEG